MYEVSLAPDSALGTYTDQPTNTQIERLKSIVYRCTPADLHFSDGV